MFKQSLALRVLAACFILLALPLLIFTFIYFNNSFNDLIKRAYGNLEEVAYYLTISIEETNPLSITFLNELKYLLDLEHDIHRLPNQEFTEKLMQLTKNIEGIDVYVLGEGFDGHYPVLAADSPEVKNTGIGPPYFISYSPLGQSAKGGSINFVRYYFSDDQKKMIPYTYSVVDIHDPNSKKVIGYIVLQKNIEREMEYHLRPIAASNQLINCALLDDNGYIAGASDPNFVGERFVTMSKEQEIQILEQLNLIGKKFFKDPIEIKRTHANSNFFEFTWNGHVQLGSFPRYIKEGDKVITYSSKKQVFDIALSQFFIIYVTLGLIIVLGAGLTFVLTRWMSHPLEQIMTLMKNVRSGNLTERFKPEKWGFELNTLGLTFNKTLNSTLENMQKAEDERVKKETYRKEIDMGKRVQIALLPKKIPLVEGVDLFATYFASHDVGGDFYDYFVKDQNLFLICSDASDLGLSPCLYALDVRSFFRAYALMHSDVAELTRLVNNAFCDDTGDSGMFATAIVAAYQTKTKILTYYSAGHVPGIVRKKNGEIIMLDKRGIALGLFKSDNYVATSIALDPGDLVLLLTNGIIETANSQKQKFTLKRIKDLIQMRNWASAKDLVEGLLQEIKVFMGNERVTEEFVLLAMKVKDIAV